jgi:hypothetical protein
MHIQNNAIPAALVAVVQLDSVHCRLCFAGSAAHVPVPATRPPDPTPSTPLHAHAVSTANEVGTHTHTHTHTHKLPPLHSTRLCLCISTVHPPALMSVCALHCCRLLIRMGMEETKRIELGFFRTEDDVRRETDKHVV